MSEPVYFEQYARIESLESYYIYQTSPLQGGESFTLITEQDILSMNKDCTLPSELKIFSFVEKNNATEINKDTYDLIKTNLNFFLKNKGEIF